jgi:hypothetical protein
MMHGRLKQVRGGLIRVAVLGTLGLLAGFIACKNSSTGPGADLNNLLANGSFEANSHPTWGHWVLLDTPVDTMTLFRQDVPPLGGSYCLELAPSAPDAKYARSYVTGVFSLGGVFQVTAWARTTNNWPNGSIALGKMSFGVPTLLKSRQISGASWTQYTFSDTFDLAVQDSIFVQLSVGLADQTLAGTARFDLVKLEKIQ